MTIAHADPQAPAALELYVYTSRYAGGSAEAPFDLSAIYERSLVQNPRFGLTGFLLFDHGRFVQFLEGAPENIDSLIRALARDPRHEGIQELLRIPLEVRSFDQWDASVCEAATPSPVAAGELEAFVSAYVRNFRVEGAEFLNYLRRCLQSGSMRFVGASGDSKEKT